MLVKMGLLTDDEVTTYLSRQYNLAQLDKEYEIDPQVVKLVPYETAKRHMVLPLRREGAALKIAMADPSNVFAMDELKFMTGFNVEPLVASETAITEGIERAYNTQPDGDNLEDVMASFDESTDIEVRDQDEETSITDLEKAAEEAPIIRLVNVILTEAVKRKASDIHLEPYEKEYRVRSAWTACCRPS